jgi:myo-inositol-1(or 4)-monophosphatase
MELSYWNDVYNLSEKWIYEAGEIIKKSFEKEVNVQYKSNPSDLVTDMDREIERFFAEKIRLKFPDHYILGEEGFGDEIKDSSGTIWIVDPIDGTMNFVHQQRHFTISVAVYHNGVGKIGLILDVVSGDLYHCITGKGAYRNNTQLSQLKPVKVEEALIGLNATWVTENYKIDSKVLSPLVKKCRGTRSYGSAALELAYVASGVLDAYITMRLSPWDYAAGVLLVAEVGGQCTTISGGEIDFLSKTSVMASSPGLHNQILQGYFLSGTE